MFLINELSYEKENFKDLILKLKNFINNNIFDK